MGKTDVRHRGDQAVGHTSARREFPLIESAVEPGDVVTVHVTGASDNDVALVSATLDQAGLMF